MINIDRDTDNVDARERTKNDKTLLTKKEEVEWKKLGFVKKFIRYYFSQTTLWNIATHQLT